MSQIVYLLNVNYKENCHGVGEISCTERSFYISKISSLFSIIQS